MDISIIIPVFNEENTVAVLYDKIIHLMDNLEESYEIIFINDGSTDNSPDILQKIKASDNKVILISFDRKHGKDSALDAGFRRSKGEKVITIDSDLQIDTIDIVRILNELQGNDVVVGCRINRLERDGFIKFISSKIANYIRNLILNENFKDVGCSLQGYRRKCIDDLKLYAGFHVYLISFLHNAGYSIKEIPIKIMKRQYGKSKYNICNRLFKGLLALFVVRWLCRNRLKYNIR